MSPYLAEYHRLRSPGMLIASPTFPVEASATLREHPPNHAASVASILPGTIGIAMTFDADLRATTDDAHSGAPLRRDQRTTTLPPTADVVVIGGGIVGISTAFALARAGLRPIIVELGDSLANLTTANASANVRAEYASRAEVELINDGLAFYGDFPAQTGLAVHDADIDFELHGGMFATTEPDGTARLAALVERQRHLGVIGASVLSGDDARRDYPWLATEVTAAMIRPHDGWPSAIRATESMARASGATICLDTAVDDFIVQDGRLTGIRTSRGIISTGRAVVATGPFVATLIRALLPIRLVRRHRLTLGSHPAIPRGGAADRRSRFRGILAPPERWRDPGLAPGLLGWTTALAGADRPELSRLHPAGPERGPAHLAVLADGGRGTASRPVGAGRRAVRRHAGQRPTDRRARRPAWGLDQRRLQRAGADRLPGWSAPPGRPHHRSPARG